MPIANDSDTTQKAQFLALTDPAVDRLLHMKKAKDDMSPPTVHLLNASQQPAESTAAQLHSRYSTSTDTKSTTNTNTTATDSMEQCEPAVMDYDEYESLPESTTVAAHLAAGAFAGIMEHTVMFPVDAIKTRIQVAGTNNIYTGIVNAVGRISAAEGFTGLWRGVSSVVLGAGPAHAVYFAVYENVKNTLGGNADKNHHPVVTSIAGATATTFSDALMNPFDVIKQRMQVLGSKYKSFGNCALDIYHREGFRAFYVSYPTTLVMNVPYTAVNFTIYESASKVLNPCAKHDPLTHCIAGGLAGGTAAAVTTPLDVIKTLLQTKTLPSYDQSKVANINSFAQGARYIYRTHGLKGFTSGMKPRVVSAMPSTAICWTSYEMAKFYISKNSDISCQSRFH